MATAAPADVIEQQLEQPLCVCATCGAAVVVYNGHQFRHCEHTADSVALTSVGAQEMARVVQ